ncbi:MAG TPA: molybdate ABC transporter substrate-binding protein [Thermoanaerobaculia bacterium]|nr:molybdate ABC transporter substrate-binding protein [Thermoanaerobaculia bacterium]
MRTARLLLVLALLGGCANETAPVPQLIVSAASDLIPPFAEIEREIERRHALDVRFNFGSSGELARQIEAGAPADVFVSANRAYVEQLRERGLVLSETELHFARGRLAIVTRADSAAKIRSIADLVNPEIGRISIADPAHAPYGVAAREALLSARLWHVLEPRIIRAPNVRLAYDQVVKGATDAAIVAVSFMTAESRWIAVPEELHAPIDQVAVVVANSQRQDAARRFVRFLSDPWSRAVLERYGFHPVR